MPLLKVKINCSDRNIKPPAIRTKRTENGVFIEIKLIFDEPKIVEKFPESPADMLKFLPLLYS